MLLNLVAVNTPEKSHMIFNILGSTNINDQLCKQINSVDIEYCQFSRSLRFNVELLWDKKGDIQKSIRHLLPGWSGSVQGVAKLQSQPNWLNILTQEVN